jgi:anti-sigma B factor antagonist
MAVEEPGDVASMAGSVEPAGFQILIDRSAAGVPVCRVVGDLDLATVAVAREELQPAVLTSATEAIVDLGGVGFCDSAGLTLLLQLRSAAENAGVGLKLAALSSPVARVFEVTGALGLFQVYETVAEAETAEGGSEQQADNE